MNKWSVTSCIFGPAASANHMSVEEACDASVTHAYSQPRYPAAWQNALQMGFLSDVITQRAERNVFKTHTFNNSDNLFMTELRLLYVYCLPSHRHNPLSLPFFHLFPSCSVSLLIPLPDALSTKWLHQLPLPAFLPPILPPPSHCHCSSPAEVGRFLRSLTPLLLLFTLRPS